VLSFIWITENGLQEDGGYLDACPDTIQGFRANQSATDPNTRLATFRISTLPGRLGFKINFILIYLVGVDARTKSRDADGAAG
jgi:hypothetical protein